MKKLKITKEQYDRLLNSGIIKESLNDVKKPETKSSDNMKLETKELLKYLYRKTEDISPIWEENGVSYDDICDSLTQKGLIIKKGGKYVLSKSAGSPEEAISAVESVLRELTGIVDEDIDPSSWGHEEGNPNNEPDEEDVVNETDYELFAYNKEIAFLKNIYDNNFYLLDRIEYGPNSVDSDDEFIEYLNSEQNNLKTILIPIDLDLLGELDAMYNLNPFMVKQMGVIRNSITGVNENDTPIEYSDYLDSQPKARTNQENKSILDKLRQIKSKEQGSRGLMKTKNPLDTHPDDVKPITKNPLDSHPDDIEETSCAGGSSGAFTAPLGQPIKRKVDTVYETTVASAGNFQYDANALPGIGRNGEFKKPKQTKAQKNTQYPNGTMVELDDCTKLNNNKKAQNGGCSTGAVDNVVKQTKKGTSIISPSLNESAIFEEISKKTGKTVEEIKKIIDNKKQ